jgi:formate hydrogenlyase regulatory protein HycA
MAKSKPTITLQVEDKAPVTAPTPAQVRAALGRMTPDGGPGFIILEGRGDDYAQAAGGDGVFTAEWRETKGKGFRHWKAGLRGKPTKGKAVVLTNGAQLTVQPNERLSASDVETILLAYLAGEGRPEPFEWRDISDVLGGADDVVVKVPQSIKIAREEGHHTDRIGKYGKGNQFMGFVTATVPEPLPKDWQAHKRWYAVLHTFDKKGKHLSTEAWFAGTTASGEREAVAKAQAKLDQMIAALGKVKYGNVEVGLFQVQIDGQTFGLVDASEPEEGYVSIHLLPNELAFFEPWDGRYDT